MKTLKTIEPYAVKYRIWDTVDYGIVYETSDVVELSYVYYESYMARKVPNYSYGFLDARYYQEISVPRYEVFTEFGEPVDIVPRYRNWRYKERYEKPLDVVYTKKNPNKIKKGYFDNGERYGWRRSHINPWHHYPYISMGYFRAVKTQNERRQNAAIIADYGDNVVRGRRRSKQLPSAWDDIPVHSWDLVKSWKHNSKRRHQWKVK
jgi:hypothetical protein